MTYRKSYPISDRFDAVRIAIFRARGKRTFIRFLLPLISTARMRCQAQFTTEWTPEVLVINKSRHYMQKINSINFPTSLSTINHI
jgi:hypothetical protein